MAYGNGGDKKLLRKAFPAGSTSLGNDLLTAGKRADLMLLRERYLAAANAFVDAVFTPEPLCGTMSGEDIEKVLVAKQKDLTGINKAYAEKARLSIAPIIRTVEKHYLGRIVGRLAHCASRIPATAALHAPAATRIYFNIPESIQDRVSPATLENLEEQVKALGSRKTLALVARVVLEGKHEGLDAETVLVIQTVHAECLERYRKPEFGKDPRYTCQIHLDYRVVRGPEADPKRLDGVARILVDKANRKFRTFLEISHPIPRGEAIRIPVVMSPKVLSKFDRNARIGSLIVEVGPDTVHVKTVASKQIPGTPDINDCLHLVARDFGYKNTVTLSVLRRDREIDPAEMKSILDFDKGEARAYLESHDHPMDNVVARRRFSGQAFLRSIGSTCARIDLLASEIKLGYNKLERLKSNICSYLGTEPDGRFADDLALHVKDPLIKQLCGKFFRLLNHIWHLKGLRLKLFAKINGLKKAWFGFLSNQELKLAIQYQAAVVREDLTVMAKEKDAPDYKGRTFNKMINNGSKGQYLRRATDKLLWDGILEVAIPSFYTSTACPTHARVDATMRKGDSFRCPLCGRDEHADEHAADTIGNYLLLRPKAAT